MSTMISEIDKKKQLIAGLESDIAREYCELTNIIITSKIDMGESMPPPDLIRLRERMLAVKTKIDSIRTLLTRIRESRSKLAEFEQLNKQLATELERSSFEFTVKLYELSRKSDNPTLQATFAKVREIDDDLAKSSEKLTHLQGKKGKHIVERIKLKLKRTREMQRQSKLHLRRLKIINEISAKVISNYDDFRDLLVSTDVAALKKEFEDSLELLRQERNLREEIAKLSSSLEELGGDKEDLILKAEEELKTLTDAYTSMAQEYGREAYYHCISIEDIPNAELNKHVAKVSEEIGKIQQEKFSLLELQREYRSVKFGKRLQALNRQKARLQYEIAQLNDKVHAIEMEISSINGKAGSGLHP